MGDVILTTNTFDPPELKCWSTPINCKGSIAPESVNLYDQNGYDLTELEKLFCQTNKSYMVSHRIHKHSLKKDWFVQESKTEGAILNHSLLFERKGFDGEAKRQLEEWAKEYPIFYKLIKQRPKWGLDFSMDYCDREGNVFEAFHWEYDSFSYDEIIKMKQYSEEILLQKDWDSIGKSLLSLKDEWFHLDFFSQSDYKCRYIGICSERFKMVIWE